MNKKEMFKKSLQANEKLLFSLSKEQLEELMVVFDNYEIKQLILSGVSDSYSDDEVSNIMTEMQNEAQTKLYGEKRWDMQKRLGRIRDKWKR